MSELEASPPRPDEGPPEDALYDASLGALARACATALLLFASGWLCPDLEWVHDEFLAMLVGLGALALAAAGGGTVWVLDGRTRDAVLSRALTLGRALPLLLAAFYAFAALAKFPVGWHAPALLAFYASLCCAARLPWGLLDAWWDWAAEPDPRPKHLALAVEGAGAIPTPAEPGAPPVEPTLVVSGSFRVATARMLDVLQRNQLADPRDFLAPWIRLAEASQARTIRLSRGGRGLEMRFDGRPLGGALLAEPYRSLNDDSDEDSPRYRHLAIGLLACLRLAPAAVTICSGRGGERTRVRLTAAGGERIEADRDDCDETVILLRWTGWRAWFRVGGYLARVRRRIGLARADVFISGRAVPWIPRQNRAWAASFTDGSVHGGVVPGGPPGANSRVYLYKQGALVEGFLHPTDHGSWEAFLADDGFQLTASQSKVVHDSRYAEALAVLKRRLSEPAALARCAPYARDAAANSPYTLGALAAAVFTALAGWSAFGWALSENSELALLLGSGYLLLTAILFGFCLRWFVRFL